MRVSANQVWARRGHFDAITLRFAGGPNKVALVCGLFIEQGVLISQNTVNSSIPAWISCDIRMKASDLPSGSPHVPYVPASLFAPDPHWKMTLPPARSPG